MTPPALSAPIAPPNPDVITAARRLCDGQAKPLGALGELEGLGAWLAGCQGACPPRPLEDVRVVVFAGDHGVAGRAVSAYPAEVTPAMVRAIAAGVAGVSALARAQGVSVSVYDLGVASDFPDLPAEVGRFKVRRSSGSIDSEDALTADQVAQALAAGERIAAEQVADGAQLLIAGDLGIGNTTVAAALVAAGTGATAAEVTGRGTGIDDAAAVRKAEVIDRALQRGGRRLADPVERLACLGSADMAAATGFMIGAARRGVPVLLDGLIAVAEAVTAEAIAPGSRAWMRAGHRSTEPGQSVGLRALGLTPLLDLSLRLGEGTGAVLAVPILRSSVAAMREIAQLTDLM